MPWFLIGYVIHQKYDNNKLKNVSIVYLIMFTLVGAVLSITPIILKTKINFSCIGIIIYSISIFLIAIKYSDKSFNKIIEYIGDKLSLNIYIFHIIIANILSYLVKAIFNFAIENTYYFPIIVLASSLLFSFTIDCIKNIIKHNNLNTIK